MYSRELALLIKEYGESGTNEDKLIQRKLELIRSLCADCGSDEFVFANEITTEFCRLIRLLQEQHQKTLRSATNASEQAPANGLSGFLPYCAEQPSKYACGEQLLGAFYNHFKKEEEVEYDHIRFLKNDERKAKINATMNDYVARIYTFCTDKNKEYLSAIFSPEEIGAEDPVLFMYRNIEIILAKFNTKDETGVSIKQRVNIRSALRKLNEFKRIEEARIS